MDAVAACYAHTLALAEDGGVWAAGTEYFLEHFLSTGDGGLYDDSDPALGTEMSALGLGEDADYAARAWGMAVYDAAMDDDDYSDAFRDEFCYCFQKREDYLQYLDAPAQRVPEVRCCVAAPLLNPSCWPLK